jgi:hypothetical protein
VGRRVDFADDLLRESSDENLQFAEALRNRRESRRSVFVIRTDLFKHLAEEFLLGSDRRALRY